MPRAYQSVFGEFEIARYVYGSREGQKITFVPLDARLQVPESKFSYLLQDWSQGLAVDNAYTQVNTTLHRILGITQSSDSLERMNRQMSTPVDCFEATRTAPTPASVNHIIVASADGKGVPISSVRNDFDHCGSSSPERSETESQENGHCRSGLSC